MSRIMLFALVIAVFAGCAQEPKEKTIMGFKYEHPTQNPAPKAQPGEHIFYHYYMKNEKGETLENSRSRGGVSEFNIPKPEAYPKKAALIEMMMLMAEGDSARLYYPIDSLPQTGGQFGDTKTLIYELVIEDIMSEQEFAAYDAERKAEQAKLAEAGRARVEEIGAMVQKTLADYKSGNLGNALQKGNGLEYVIHEEGTGENIQRKDNVTANYYGVLQSDGSMFDNSFSRGQPFSFVDGKGMVIAGWDEGFKLLKKGSKATLFIPYQMAYGENGRSGIPAKSDLVFYVEVVDVNQ